MSVTSFHIRYGKGDDFRSAIARMYDAAQKTKWPLHYRWERLVPAIDIMQSSCGIAIPPEKQSGITVFRRVLVEVAIHRGE